jgi:hypothetical protein
MKTLFSAAGLVFIAIQLGCSSAPQKSDRILSSSEGQQWLKRYCSSAHKKVEGQMVIRSNTPEFKGQFPASIQVQPNGTFHFEVTHLLGGTLVQIRSDASGKIDIKSPSKPRLNRKEVDQYLGLPTQVLSQLLRGDLPCPSPQYWSSANSNGNDLEVLVPATATRPEQVWSFGRVKEVSDSGTQEVPGVLFISPQNLELSIDEWDASGFFAKKAKVKTPQGELKWTWRSRNMDR